VVATASEYVPRSMTFSHPGHSYTSCLGSSSYFGRFSSYGDSGSISGTADTNTNCSTTWEPPTTSTTTLYRRYNYTIVRSENALYLLSCNPRTAALGVFSGLSAVVGAAAEAGGNARSSSRIEPDYNAQKCVQSFGIGAKYLLTIDKSHVLLGDTTGSKPIKMDYVSSAALPPLNSQPEPPQDGRGVNNSEVARVHITSSPSGGEIYVDGKFVGNTPSDITIAAGEHIVKITSGGKEWSRAIRIMEGEIRVHAELTEN
jgi:hypothetical protein